MNAARPTLAAPTLTRSRKNLTVASLVALLSVLASGLMATFPSHALDLVAFVGIGGPLAAALRNFGPVLFYLGMAIFGAVGLTIAGAILGAVI